jgi:small conductance mechanosensitive channel
MNSSSVDFFVFVWAKGEHYWDMYFYMQEHLKKAFDANGISIPFPQMDVHIKPNLQA